MERKSTLKREFLGYGAEGEVYKIAPNLVKKYWKRINTFKIENIEDIKTRHTLVQQQIEALPEGIKEYVKTPKLVAINKINSSYYQAASYHEYIPKDTKTEYSKEEINRLTNILYVLMNHFTDIQFNGCIISDKNLNCDRNYKIYQGKIYLIDVWVKKDF